MGASLRVLIVEDSEEDSLLMLRELKRGGYDPVHNRVETAKAMKAALKKQPWDVILCDYVMPRFSAPAALKTLKESGLDIPFIIVSGSIGEDTAVTAMKAGANDYLMKNNLRRLIPSVEQELREAEMRRKLRESEKALQESEKRYRQVVESATEIIYTVDEKGNFTYANPAGLKVTGYSQGELRKLNYADLVVLEHRERVAEIYTDQLRQRIPTTHVEFPFFNKTGEITWFSQNTSLITEDGRVVGFHIIARDITERKQSEEALRKSEERFRGLFNNAPVGYHEYDIEGRITSVNRTELEMLGYTLEERIGQFVWSSITEEDKSRQTVLAKLAGVIPPSQSLERTYRRKDGTTFPVLIQDQLLCDENGRITGMRSTIQDITERKQAEEALAKSEERYRSLFNLVPIGIYRTTPEGKILEVNPALIEMLGFPDRESLLGRGAGDTYVDPAARTELKRLLEKDGLVLNFQRQLRRYDGSVIWVLENTRVVRDQDGQVLYYQGSFQDITDRMRAEEALSESEQRYRNLVENAPDVIFTLAPDGTIASLSPAFETITGWPRAEWLQKQFISILYPDDLSAGLEFFQRILKGEKPPPFQLRVLKKSSDYLVAEFTVTPQTQNGSVLKILGIARDITERKRAEEALQRAEEKYRTILETMAEGYYEVDLAGNFTFFNERLCRMLGYTRAEVTGMNNRKYMDGETAKKVFQIFSKLYAEDGPPETFEWKITKKDGTIRYHESSVSIIKNATGRKVGFKGIARDITERKQTEEALRDREERFRALADTTSTAIIIYQGEQFAYANKATEIISGYSNDEILTMRFWDLMHPEFRDLVRGRGMARQRGESIMDRYEVKIRCKDGSERWIDYTAGTIQWKGEPAIIGTAFDITERKQAEENLKQSEENARQVAHENAVMAEIGRIISSTLNIDEVYEGFAEEVKKIIPFDRIVINIIDIEKNTVRNVYMSGKGVQDRNVKDFYPLEGSGNAEMVRTKSTLLIQTEDFSEYKNRFPMLLSTFQAGFRSIMNVPLFSKGKVIGGLLLRSYKPYAYTDKDVKLAERIGSHIAGAIANAQLYAERIIAEKEKEALQEQLRQSQKMEAIGRLAGGIAHDFNNLLTIIKGYSQLSLLELREGDPIKGNLEEVRKASDRASDLIRQLLAFSRRQILDVMVLDLNMVMGDLDKMLRRVIGEDIELVTLFVEDLGRVKTDPGQIQQVIMNLAVNARDAMPNGGKLTIETANVELDEVYARAHVAVKPGRYVMLSVSDTGVGMSAEVRDQIFEPFFTTKERDKGTGLGLSTVYGIVKQSGGNIWVYSEPSHGTTFKIYLPHVDEPLEEVREAVVRTELPRGSETILVVEDEKEVLKLASRILKGQGYRILEAATGEEALMVCKENKEPFHLLLTDVVMPQMSGRQLKDQLERVRGDFKVLYMSGYTDNAIVHHGVLEKGMNFIQKPFTLEGLARKVREVLDK